MSKRRYRFGYDYFAEWTLDRIYFAGYTIQFTRLSDDKVQYQLLKGETK
jgi:hypothetical protein